MKKNLSKKKNPLVSVITPTYNQGEYLEECITSVQKQTYDNIEHIVIDGKSDDNTVALLKKYKHIKWISEKDKWYWEAVIKGIKLAKGKYVMICMASDGYQNKNWIKKCVEVMEANKEVSLVWGFPQWLENGKLTDISYLHFYKSKAPQKFEWFPYWLMTGETFPNGNFCIHKKVFEACNTIKSISKKGEEFFELNYNFNRMGYIPYNIHEIAEFGRQHPGQLSEVWTKQGWYRKATINYNTKINKYKESLLAGKQHHVYRNSLGEKINKHADISKVSSINQKLLKARIMVYLIMQRAPKKIVGKIKQSIKA